MLNNQQQQQQQYRIVGNHKQRQHKIGNFSNKFQKSIRTI